MMKRIIIILTVVISGFTFGQQQTDNNPYVYEEVSDTPEGDVFPGNPGDPNAAPIDEYVPFLLLTALAMIAFYKKRNSILSK